MCDTLLAVYSCVSSRFLVRVVAAPDKGDESITYNLVGVSNHSGGLGGGHYTAYVPPEVSCDQPSDRVLLSAGIV